MTIKKETIELKEKYKKQGLTQNAIITATQSVTHLLDCIQRNAGYSKRDELKFKYSVELIKLRLSKIEV